ncbi:MAG TPA: S8 family serine peptidase, partial [Herpetosiphonaceae bacterium]|nr:S8 family serine peptidase [Herpetosiphonaceae bacterium]
MSIDRRLGAIVALALVLLHVTAPAGQAQARLSTRANAAAPRFSEALFTSERLVVGLRARSDFAAKSLAQGVLPFQKRWGSAVTGATPVGENSFVVETRSAAAARGLAGALAADPAVEYVEPEYRYHAALRPDDRFYDRLHAMPRIGAEQAWDISTGNPNIMVAVVDTGIYAGHPDLGQNAVNGYDFVNGDADASDDEGHGTHTAGIVAAVGNNGRGVAGVCWQCKVLAVKVLDREGGGSSVAVAAGIRYAADRGARVINLSLGGPNDSRLLRDAVRYATDRGALLIVASGNEAEEGNPIEYPAAYPEALSVGAIDINEAHA